MTNAGTKRSKWARGTRRGSAPQWLGSVVVAAVLIGSTGCEKDDGGVSEAVEEVQDELGDAAEATRDKAREAKEEIVDEVDDHT